MTTSCFPLLRNRKARWALTLAAAIFILASAAGPETVHHLRGSVKDLHSCSLYHWSHGAGAGTPSCFVLSAALPVSGVIIAQAPTAAPEVSAHPTPSRAPPVVG